MTDRLVIIGGVAAGAKAAAKARRIDRDLEILVFQDEPEISYSACGFPYVLSRRIDHKDKIIVRKPESFASENIGIFIRHRVESIDLDARQLTATDLHTGRDTVVGYDRLIIATGARPIVPAIEGLAHEGVTALRSITDLERMQHCLDALQPQKVAVVGAGYVALELAETFHTLGLRTTLVDKAQRILPRFDPELAQRVHDHLSAGKIELVLGDCPVHLHDRNGAVEALETESGRVVPCDLVVLAAGVTPNVELARRCGVALGTTGAIAVDSRMETNSRGVFAAGDCCETTNRITDAATWQPLGDIANLQGRVAGENAAGGNAHFPGVFGTAIFRSLDLNVAITGLSIREAEHAGLEPMSVHIKSSDRARYYPGGRAVDIVLIADRTSGRLLGAQAIGSGAVDKMIDIAATALLGRLTCSDLENADLAYAPPFSRVLSPMIAAASALNNTLKKARGQP